MNDVVETMLSIEEEILTLEAEYADLQRGSLLFRRIKKYRIEEIEHRLASRQRKLLKVKAAVFADDDAFQRYRESKERIRAAAPGAEQPDELEPE